MTATQTRSNYAHDVYPVFITIVFWIKSQCATYLLCVLNVFKSTQQLKFDEQHHWILSRNLYSIPLPEKRRISRCSGQSATIRMRRVNHWAPTSIFDCITVSYQTFNLKIHKMYPSSTTNECNAMFSLPVGSSILKSFIRSAVGYRLRILITCFCNAKI